MATSSAEIERKYAVGADLAVPDLRGGAVAAQDEPVVHLMQAVYLDTAELQLVGSKRTLRRRVGGSDEGWHLKLPRVGDARTELHEPLRDGDAQAPLEGLGERLPAELRSRLGDLADARFVPVAVLETRRTELAVRDEAGSVLAVLCDDVVEATCIDPADGQRDVTSWREWEVELVDGGVGVLDELEQRLLAAGAAPADSASKLAQALRPVLARRGLAG